MAIINRISRLFTADVHAVLDRMEEPEVLLRQSIREMEEQLAGTGRHINGLVCEREQIEARQQQIEKSLVEIESQLDVCFAAGKADLARNLIRRRLENQRFSGLLAARRDGTEKELAASHRRLDENRVRLESMRQKAELFVENERPVFSPERDKSPRGFADTRVSDDEVEVAFLAEQRRRTES